MIKSNEKYSNMQSIHVSDRSTVYSAFDESTHTMVALKTANQNISDVYGFARLHGEFSIMSKVKSEYVPKALDYSKIGDDYFLVMEYREGTTL